MSDLGRPIKGTTRRIPITVHTPMGDLEKIDEYVEKRKARKEPTYSRSDFFTEAIEKYMKELGISQ
jgi:hypothetical protein